MSLTRPKPKHRTRVRAGGVWYLTEMSLAEWRGILCSDDTTSNVYDAVREKEPQPRALVSRKNVCAVEEVE